MSWINLLEAFYPVGSVYLSTVSISPASIVGGTWKQQESGCLACANTPGYASAGQNGGSSIIRKNQIPAHTHKVRIKNAETGATWNLAFSGGGNQFSLSSTWVGSNDSDDGAYAAENEEGGAEYYPLHFSVYVWVRTA